MSSESTEPTGVDLRDSQRELVVSWADGSATAIPYRELRLGCRCALCVDELTGKPLLDPATVPEDVGVADCWQVGLYGLQIAWTTGHRTGIYTWERLRGLGSTEPA